MRSNRKPCAACQRRGDHTVSCVHPPFGVPLEAWRYALDPATIDRDVHGIAVESGVARDQIVHLPVPDPYATNSPFLAYSASVYRQAPQWSKWFETVSVPFGRLWMIGPWRILGASGASMKEEIGMARLYAATDSAVAVIEGERVDLALEGRGGRCLAVDPNDTGVLYVGTSEDGLFKSEDGGGSWDRLSGVPHPMVTAVAVSPVDGSLYAGTEPSALFVSRDGGASWRELEGLRNLPSAPTWSFPPRPWTSHVRAIAPGPSDLVVAGIELGGVVRTSDGGERWQDQRPGAYADCHALATHPAAPKTIYEAAGGGFAQSGDFGDNWEAADAGISHRYVWGLALDVEDPTLIYVSAASGPGRAHGSGHSDAAIYRRKQGGRWEPVLEGLAAFPYALATDPEVPGAVYAGLGDGTILFSLDTGDNWEEIARVPSGLAALTVVAA